MVRDALVRRHAMGRNPGGSAYGYETRVAYDGNGERIRGLQQIVPAEAAVVVRIYEDYAAGLSPIAIARRLNLGRRCFQSIGLRRFGHGKILFLAVETRSIAS